MLIAMYDQVYNDAYSKTPSKGYIHRSTSNSCPDVMLLQLSLPNNNLPTPVNIPPLRSLVH